MKQLLLKNGRVIDPANGIDGQADVLLEKGKVQKVGARISPGGADVIDCKGLLVCPGFIDMHVHLREPGQEWKETIETGTRCAAHSGFTAVACMPNTTPVNDSRSVTELIVNAARERGMVRVHPIGAVSKGQKGEELAEMSDMVDAGAVAFSDDGHPVRSSLLMRKALEYSQIFGVPVIDHCEDRELVDGGVMNEGDVSTRLGLKGWPSVAEDILVQRDILLAEYTGGHVHIAHMSTGKAAEFVRRAKKQKVKVTCEVTPHHFALTDEAVGEFDTDAKMNPPLRSEADRKALIKAIADGTIDAIATDHAPHHPDEKCVEFACAPFGIIGLETAIPLSIDLLVHAGVISWDRLVELFTVNPARILGIEAGTLTPGVAADVTVIDPDREFVVDKSTTESKSVNTPFHGWKLRGCSVLTIVGGRIVHNRDE
ncbi:dihydroorotase [Acidobacteria bacterium Mor1]|nr:dihydroorotase [Acidobacteria bacterium Mor1]